MSISLTARHIVKRFSGVVALAEGDLTVDGGEVVALLGANGSGKSTLAKIITGVLAPDEGRLEVDGQAVTFSSPQGAIRRGITAVYQELSLIPDMTVTENIWLNHEPMRWSVRVDRTQARRRTEELLALFQGAVSPALMPETPVAALPPDEKQIVEILKALSREPLLMILDEATASLDARQVSRLFKLMDAWKADGMALVFVSHRMEEIFRVADRAVVLRNGRTVGERAMSDVTERDLVTLMVGDEPSAAAVAQPDAAQPVDPSARPRLQIDRLRSGRVHDVSLAVHDGELVGLGGLRGQGQDDLLLAVFGALPFTGKMALAGEEVKFNHPRQAVKRDVAYVPGERGSQGLLLIRSILENFQLPSWVRYGTPLKMGQARQDAAQMGASLRLVMASLDAPVSSLSGGNAQKVVLGKWLLREPRLLLLNDPTKGVDVGAKAEIYQLLEDLRRAGTAILFYSSEDEELLNLCDRVLVMQDGRITAELSGVSLQKENLVAASMGAVEQAGDQGGSSS
ncbi:MAG: sugar ABC transporter ATP-binding protein [Caldilineaceae bacterium]|nr:sugar ABC transporter ATP-binding protein [Caldilineaceae bacterium]